MADDFQVKITADLDTSEAEQKLNDLINDKNKLKIDVELNQNSAKKLSSDIEKGVKQTKLDTSSISKQLADSFNISDKQTINRIKSQLNSMVATLSKAWNGSDFHVTDKGFQDFFGGIEPLKNTLSDHAKLVQGATGIYDKFFDYFKDKKIFISDALKDALDTDTYKELLQDNIGKITRDATKGVDISSIWGEMKSLFPEHFSDDVISQADQLLHTFDLVKKAREDMVKTISYADMDSQMKQSVDDLAWKQASDSAELIMKNLKNNIQQASEISKTTIDLDVNVNTEKITADIRNAIQNAGTMADEPVPIELKINEEQLVSSLRSAINRLASGDEPVKVDVQVNKDSLKSELQTALSDIELPVDIKVDADSLADEIRAAVNSITDLEVDLHVNTNAVRDEVDNTVNTDNITIPMGQGKIPNLYAYQQMLNNINAAGARGQSVFQRLGGSIKEAFSIFTMADMFQDGIYEIIDAGKQGLETVKEFNDLKTDLAMATGEGKAYVNDLMKSYNDLGQELGSVTRDVASSADSWLRQGRTMAETNQLIQDSMVLSKDAQMDSEQASKVLTATLNGFQMSADQAGHINDILMSIDNQSASDAGGIGEALSRTASMANNAGVSLEKTAAMIATIKDVTQQSDETIGTSVKSILSRMNNIKVGKFVDDETGESLNDVEKVLEKVGISMRDVNGQFQDSEITIDSIAEKWSTFDKNTQKAISTAVAGTRQINSFISVMDNWDKVQSLTDAAFNSDGTAQKKFEENYMTSLDAKTNALKASMENLATTVVSDDMYAGFLDGAKAVTDFVAQTDLLQASLAGLGAAGGAFALNWIGDMVQGFNDLSSAMDIVKATNITDDAFEGLLNLTQGLSESQTKLVLSSKALSDAQRIAILMGQGMSQAEAQSAVAAMGLASAQGAATASTVTLSGALKGLWATLAANPLILIAAGVTAAVAAVSAYNHSIEEAVSSARESGNAWEESHSSLQDNVTKIEELRAALESGTLSEQEAAQAKSELLSIQESLSESYGNQVEGIDLLNGSLTEQLALLDKVAQKEAEAFKNENKKGIDKARKEMEKDRHTYLGQFYDNGSEESEALKKSLSDLQKEYGKEVFDIQKNSDGITMDVHFNADAAQAREALNDFMTDVSRIEEQYGASDTLDLMSANASSGLTEAKEVLDEYQDLYNQAQKAELLSDDRLFKADGKKQIASKWLSDYAKSIEVYNKAVSEGDSAAITQAKSQFDAIDAAMSGLADGKMSAYADQIEEVRSQLNETAIATDKFNKAVKGQDSSEFGKGVTETVNALKELSLSDTDFKYAFETDGIQDGEEAVQSMVQAAIDCGVISDSSASSVNNLVSMLVQLGVISSSTGSQVDAASDAVAGLSAEVEAANSALSGIQAATSLLTSQSAGKSISVDDFNSKELKDYTSALEYHNGVLQLNADKVRELQKAQADQAIQQNDNLKLEKQSQYMQNIAEIEELQDALRGLSDAKGEQAETIQSSIDSLLTENDSLFNQCSQLDLLSASLREATGAYQNWLDKQNTSESGDMFDDALGAMQHIDDTTQNTDSEYYGRIGRESYQAAVEFIIPESVDGQNAEAVQSYMDSIEHYFTHDADGNRMGLDVAEFCQSAVDQGLMTIDEASGQYQIAGQTTMQDFVDGLNLSMPMIQAFFGEMEEFGGQFSWADEAIKTFGDLGMAAGEAKARIEEASGGTGMDIQIDVSDIETTEGKISALENTISQMQDYKGTVGLDSSQVEDANTIIQYCITQKQMLEAPAVMSVDASQVSGEIGNAISLLQQFQQTQDTMELQAAIGADTSEAEGKLNGLVGEIQALSPEVKAKLGIDGTSVASIQTSIQGLTPEVMVKAGIDSSEVDAYAAQEKKSGGTVKWKNDTATVDAWAAENHTSNGTVIWGNNTANVKTSFSAEGIVHWTNTTPPSGGGHGVNGTAHASGTAHYPHLVGHANAKGNWGTKTGGMTLVGELGREIVVDPASGTWHTVGDNGAEFTNIPKGSIVFNHLQTEALLERGFVTGRGMAKASGSAMVTGGISIGQAHLASGNKPSSNNSTHSNTNSYNNNTGAVNSNTKATNDNTKAAKKSTQVFDWVERRLKYFADRTKAIADSINDYISFTQKKNLLYKQVNATNSEMQVNYKSARAYYKKAQSLGLDAKTRKLIEEGRYSIDDIDTSTESGKAHYDKVQKYMNYYDEYTKCIDAVRELRNEQVELFAQWAAIPTEEAEKKIDKLTQSYNGLAAIQARLETAGMGGSAQALLMKQLDDTMRYANNNKKKTDEAWKKQNDRLSSAQNKEETAKTKAGEDKTALNTAKKNLTKKQKGVSLTSEEKKRINSGQALSTKGLSGKKKQLVQEYNSALKKSQSSDKAYKSAQSYTKKVQNSDEYKNAKDAKHTNDVIYLEYKKNWEAAKKAYDEGDPLSYQNYLVDQELALLKQQNDAKNTAYRQTNRNTQTATKRKNSHKSRLDSVKNKGKSYSKKYAKYLTAEQEKQLAAGKKINTDNIKNENVKKIIDQYNIDLQNAMNSYTAATQQLTAAQEAEAEAAANAAQSQAEYAQAQVEAEKTKFDNIKKYYEQRIEYQESLNKLYDKQREYDKTHGDYTTSESFDKPINEIDKAQKYQEEAAKKLQEQLDKAVKAGTIKEYSDEWLEMKSEIMDAQTAVQDYENQIEQLKQEQILVMYEEMFDRAIAKAEKFKDKIEAINSLITEEMMFDYETGHLTEFGALSIVLNAKQLDTSLTTLKDYVKKRQQIMDDFKADKFGEETYDKLMAENDASLQGALKDAQAYQQAIIGIIKDQAKAEQDALFKVIDARKDALQKKKDYYDYDKTIKNKAKEINLLKQQIAALDGVFAPYKLFNCGNVPITLFRYNRTGNGTCECGMC